jgi:GT2 family glycosyltransferase
MSEVSIIIPTYNKCSRLALTLWALQRQTLPASSYEVIIVDDGSSDDTASVVQYAAWPEWRYIAHVHAGRAYTRNIGAQHATAPLLVFLDDDILVCPDFIESHLTLYREDHTRVLHGGLYDLPFLRFFDDPQTGTLIAQAQKRQARNDLADIRLSIALLEEDFTAALALQRPRRSMLEKVILRILAGWEGPVGPWLACVGANLAISHSILDAAGGFDETFGLTWGCEDLELGYRLYQQGYRFVEASKAVGYHMTHYREAALAEHRISYEHFYAKHRSPEVKYLQDFLEGRLPTLEAYAAAIATEIDGTLPSV